MSDRFRFRTPVYGPDGKFRYFVYWDTAECAPVMQCTGLKDKNGTLIYEGDIVRVFYDHFDGNFTEREVVGPVVWECGTWIVKEEEVGWFLNQAPEYDETHWESAAVEVIGNIHENADLLKEKSEKPIL